MPLEMAAAFCAVEPLPLKILGAVLARKSPSSLRRTNILQPPGRGRLRGQILYEDDVHLDERSDSHLGISNKGGMCTSASFPTTNIPLPYEPQLTPPGQGVVAQGDGVIALGASGEYTAKFIKLRFFGQGSVGSTFNVQVFQWSSTNGQFLQGQNSLGVVRIWIPVLLGQYTVTLGSNTGVPTTDIPGQYLFASTIVQTYGPTAIGGVLLPDQAIYSPGSATPAININAGGYSWI